MSWSVFSWTSALEDFLNPYHHLTPLVELPVDLNPYAQDGVRVFLKLQTFLPLGNIKSLSARGMLHQAKESWQFDDQLPHTIVENSSGNTAFSLAVLGRSMGIPKMRAWVSQEITKGKLQLLQLFGVEAVVHAEQICPNPQDPRSGIVKAREEGKQAWRYNPDQYHNIANPQIHTRLTGKQLSEQLQSLKDEVEFRFFVLDSVLRELLLGSLSVSNHILLLFPLLESWENQITLSLDQELIIYCNKLALIGKLLWMS